LNSDLFNNISTVGVNKLNEIRPSTITISSKFGFFIFFYETQIKTKRGCAALKQPFTMPQKCAKKKEIIKKPNPRRQDPRPKQSAPI